VNKLLHGPLSHLRGLQDIDERRETIKNLADEMQRFCMAGWNEQR